jgi:excisionase family DNA binding protein
VFIFNYAVNVGHMTGHLTPQKAAQRAGVGRTTIMRALEREELKAMRDNAGRWKISSDSLDDWVSMRPVRSDVGQSPSAVSDSDHGQELAAAKVEIATLKAQKDGLEARLSDAHAERDRIAATLDKALEARRGFLERIFRVGNK